MKYPCIYSALLTVLLFALQACSSNKKDAGFYHRLDQQLQTASRTVNTSTEQALHSFEKQLQEEGIPPRAAQLYSTMLDVNAKARDISELIEQLRISIIKDAGNDPYAADANIPKSLLLKTGMAKKLWQELVQLRLLNDSLTHKTLSDDRTLKLSIDSIKTEEVFLQTYFNNATAGKVLVNLSVLQHDAAQLNYFAARFMQVNLGATNISFSTVDVNIGITQNTRQAKPGEPVKITADIRDFTLRSEPKVFINNMPVNAPDGVAATQVKAEGTGLQTIAVAVYFKRKDGVPDSVVRSVIYKVMEATKH